MIRGRVHNGVVEFNVPGLLREGTEVAVQPLDQDDKESQPQQPRQINQALAQLAGKAEGLPPDAARNVDHYLYGHAKQ